MEANAASASDEAADDFNRDYDPTLDLIRFLVAPQVVSLPDIATLSDFADFDTVILADVPRLPAAVATSLAKYVADGGGLLVAAGQKTQPDFFNGWTTEDKAPLLPATLGEVTFASGDQPFSPSAQTLTHPALQKIADASKSDFAGTVITNFRPQNIPDALSKESSVGARLNNGDILLTSRKVGRGQVILLGIPLDLSSGNLVTRQAFLPLIHELVYHLADPAAYQLNLEPGWEVNIGLTGKRGRAIGEGLIGRYYASQNATEAAFTRQDEAINFNWLNGIPAPGIPADNFRVEWTGKIQLPDPKKLNFKIEVDDAFEFWIDGKPVGQFNGPGGDRRLSGKFDENRWYDFRAVFREDSGEAKAILRWEADGLPSQIVPSTSFRSFSNAADATGRETGITSFEVRGPNDRPRSAQLSSMDGGSVLKLQGDISSGLYHLKVPAEQSPFFAAFLRKDSKEIPFTVKRDAAESRLVRLTDADYAFLANFVTLSQPQTLEELIGFLNGNQFGQELWKYLALGAFAFLLIEIVLSRWIAQSRRMGEEIKIHFESKDAPTNTFREELARFGKAAGGAAGNT